MNFVKTTLALATVACMSAPAFAVAPLTVYGKVNLSLESADEGNGSSSGLSSNASRLGVQGGTELSDGLTVIYQMEFEVNIDDAKGDAFGKRNQWIGVEGHFGQFLFGRNDTMLKQSQGSVDLFNDLKGDIKGLGFKGENRMGETFTYKTPVFNQFQVGATVVLEDSDKQADENGYSIAGMYGDSKLKKSPVYASVAYDSSVAGYDVLRATVQGKVADFVLGAMYQDQEKDGGESQTGYLFNAAYKMDVWTFKAQYQMLEEGTADLSSLSVGADYKLASSTKLYAFYTTNDYDGKKDDHNYIGLGLDHKF